MKTRTRTIFLLLNGLFVVGCSAISVAVAPTATQLLYAYTPTVALTSTSTSTISPTLTLTLAPPPVTDTQTNTPTNTPTPTPGVASFTLNGPAFCRKGPDISWPDVTGINKGETVAIQGVSEDGYWYFVLYTRYKVKCWVAASTGKVSGNMTGIPVLVAPNTPTPTK